MSAAGWKAYLKEVNLHDDRSLFAYLATSESGEGS